MMFAIAMSFSEDKNCTVFLLFVSYSLSASSSAMFPEPFVKRSRRFDTHVSFVVNHSKLLVFRMLNSNEPGH